MRARTARARTYWICSRPTTTRPGCTAPRRTSRSAITSSRWKATDAAGNSNEVSVTITVIERKPVKINLSPGWNLISLPGMPASADVNDVFSSDTVSVISQYDGRRVSPWTVWTRGSDGSLSSSPAGRTTIDSGLGLWVLSSDGSALEVDIPGTSKDAPAEVPPSIDLIAGWNLVAVILISVDKVGVNEYLPEGVWTRAVPPGQHHRAVPELLAGHAGAGWDARSGR